VATAARPALAHLGAALGLAVTPLVRAGFVAAMAADVDDRDTLLDELREVYRDTKGQRVDDCVHHFAGEAFNRGVRAASTDVDERYLVDAGAKPSVV
jgi:hypothetical protein